MASIFGSVVLNNHPFKNNIATNSTFISVIEDELRKSHQSISSTVFSLSIINKTTTQYDCENSTSGKTRCFYEILVADQSLPRGFPNLTNTESYSESLVQYNGKRVVQRLLVYRLSDIEDY